ncbi:hypothetical protein CKO15_09830 [Halorhodospira abdelmalekii]|uniref:hypothetical protein n=1 Tax=Halorhodospira abdelmalekii TaxID=421629 RepID=UPI001903BDA6|nr:hypothetical protein [Halorhodospira abdelmalekii]MBK1735577.1 hypothetical protein [Halorhodospira abdelmalekii]
MDQDIIDRIVELSPGIEAHAAASGLSTGERCYVALATGCYELLPIGYRDPLEAWHRLDGHWQAAVCQARGWPLAWAGDHLE